MVPVFQRKRGGWAPILSARFRPGRARSQAARRKADKGSLALQRKGRVPGLGSTKKGLTSTGSLAILPSPWEVMMRIRSGDGAEYLRWSNSRSSYAGKTSRRRAIVPEAFLGRRSDGRRAQLRRIGVAQ
jgi:hypothetical protein